MRASWLLVTMILACRNRAEAEPERIERRHRRNDFAVRGQLLGQLTQLGESVFIVIKIKQIRLQLVPLATVHRRALQRFLQLLFTGWLRLAAENGLEVTASFKQTPFVTVFVLQGVSDDTA